MNLKSVPRKGKIIFAYKELKRRSPEEAEAFIHLVDSGEYTAVDIANALNETMIMLGYQFNITGRAMAQAMKTARDAAITFEELLNQIERGQRDA